MCILIFSTTFVWNISHSEKNTVRYYHKITKMFMWSTYNSCKVLITHEYTQHISKKNPSNIKFHEYPYGNSLIIPCRQTNGQRDTQRDMMKLTTGCFHNFANVPKNQTFVLQSKLNKHIFFFFHCFTVHVNSVTSLLFQIMPIIYTYIH